MTPSIYLNLEDDVAKIVARIKREKADTVVLVCPKRCYLFNDSINLRLLKKQVDLLRKEVFILTMDERGQGYAKEAGFQLKFLPKSRKPGVFSDIAVSRPKKVEEPKQAPKENPLISTVKEITNVAKLWGRHDSGQVGKQPVEEEVEEPVRHATSRPKTGGQAAKVTTPKILVNDAVFPKEIEQVQKVHKKRVFNQKAITGLVAISLIVVLAVVLVILPKATVVIYPKSEPVTRDVEVSIASAVATADAGRLIMPATKVDQTLDATNQFQSQGKKEVGNKASGTVQIFNFTRSPLNLKAGTTVLTVGGKSYSLVSDISQLKPTAYKNAATKEVNEGTLTPPVEIVASDGGDDFNLPAGTRMEITNQVFGSKPQFLYAKTATAITGGTSRYLSLVSDQDVSGSQSALEQQAVQNLQGILSQNGLVMPDKFFTIQDMQFSTDKPVGAESPSFTASLRTRITGLAFKKDDLEKLISDRISQTLSSDKILQANESALSYKLKTMDLNNGTAVIDAHFEGNAVYNVDISGVAPSLVGKTEGQVNEILKSREEINKIEITLAPAWQRNFPWFVSKINVLEGKVDMEGSR